MKLALIQSDGQGVPENPNLYAAYHGFQERGVETIRLEKAELLEALPALASRVGLENAIVCGTVRTVRQALDLIGIAQPAALDYPDSRFYRF